MDSAWLGWTAGIIDGEGCIWVERNNHGNSKGGYRYGVHIDVGNTDRKMIAKLVELWGGRIIKKISDKSNSKQVYRWHMPICKIKEIGKKILPYLITKKLRMILAIKLRNRIENRIGLVKIAQGKRGGQRLSGLEEFYRKEIREEIMVMNKRGGN